MDFLKTYAVPRLIQWAVVIAIGVTLTFIIPRLLPGDPVEQTLRRFSSQAVSDPRAVEEFKNALRDMYGLQGSPVEQYFRFWGRLLQGDLGPSLGAFPTPVTAIIRNALPWTVGLLLSSIIISWILGMVLGTLAGYFPNKLWSQVLDKVLITIYPVPYFIVALTLVIIFTYYLPIFPMVGGASGRPGFTWPYIRSILSHAFLPALSLVLGGTAFRYLIAKAMSSTIISSDYVNYAELAGLPRRKIIFGYVMRNSLLPQVTDLALSLGALFEGALITEVAFSYPGIGFQLFTAILQSDFNLIMGVTLFSIVGIATAVLLVDLIYPLLDPRVRYR
ncbi:MAG TPA: ABC transporter permease [Roseiflexaceae bacterium]|nr:ABC transporter permease [Roseiflexaceae bacterium]